MRESWLGPNRRILSIGLAIPVSVIILGTALALAIPASSQLSFLRWAGWALLAAGVFTAVVLVYLMRLPRLGYENGHLLAYLESTKPIRIPVEIVECFFLGQASTRLTSSAKSESETATIVVRLAESQRDWHHRKVKPALAQWCDGYITIYGTWCEPINSALAQRLNDRLIEAHREAREVAQRQSQ